MHPREAVEEGLGEALAAAPLLQGVLCGEEAEVGVALKGGAQFGDEHLSAVVQDGVQALQNGLARQVQLVQQHPGA